MKPAAPDHGQQPALDAAVQAKLASLLEVPEYQPLTTARRWLIAALAIGTASAIVLTLVGEPGGVKRAARESAARASASASLPAAAMPVEQVTPVIVFPVRPAASKP